MAIRDIFNTARRKRDEALNGVGGNTSDSLSAEAEKARQEYYARHQTQIQTPTVTAPTPTFTPAVSTTPTISGDTVTRTPAKNQQARIGTTTVKQTGLSAEAEKARQEYYARRTEQKTLAQRTELLGGLAEQTRGSYNDLMQRVTEFVDRNTDPRKANADEISALRKEISDLSAHYRDYGNTYDTTYDGSPSGQFLTWLNAKDADLAQIQNRKRTWDEMSPFEQLAFTAREKTGDRAEAYEEYLATDYDIDAAKRQIGDLQSQIDEIKRSTYGNAPAPAGDRYDAEAAYAEKRQQMTDLETRIGQLETEIGKANGIRAERAEAEEYDRVMAPYRALTTSQQFVENNGYHSTRHGESVRNDFSGVYTDTGFDDILHDYINRNPDAINAQIAITTNDNTAFLGIAPTQLAFLTDEERDIYNYLYNVQGKEPAQEFLKSIGSYLNKRNRAAEAMEWSRDAKENPFGSSLISIPLNAIGGVLGSAAAAADRMQGKEIDPNAGEFRLTRIPAEIRSAVAEKISDTWAGDTGSFLYQTGMSMADFLFTTAVTGGFSGGGKAAEALNLGIMGSTAAANSVIEAKDAGMDDKTAFIIGAIAGAAEIITEKISLESLLDKTNLDKSVRGYILKNILAEGSEEAASDLMNIAADIIIAGDQGTFAADVREHGAAQAVMNRLKEIGLDALGGAISGGVMAGAGAVINSGIGDTIRNTGPIGTYHAGQDIVQNGELGQLIDDSQTFNPETRAYRLGAELKQRFADKGIDLQADAQKLGIRATYDAGRLSNRVQQQRASDIDTYAVLQQAASDMAAGEAVSDENARAVLADRGARRELGLTSNRSTNASREVTDALVRYTTAQERTITGTANNAATQQNAPQRAVNRVELASDSIERTTAVQERDTKAVTDFADTLGKAGNTAVVGLYNPSVNAEAYIPAANAYYNAGRSGTDINAVQNDFSDRLSPAEKEAIWKAGQTDAMAVDSGTVTEYNSPAPVTANINEEGSINVREERTAPVRGDQVGSYRQDTGVADQSVRAGAEARGIRAETAESGRAEQVNYGQVAGQEVRISDLTANGSRNRFVKVVDAGWYSTDLDTDNAATKRVKAEMRKAESDLKSAGVENVRFVVGAIVKNNYRTVRGITSGDGKTVTVRIDHPTRSVTEIAKHEEYHIRSAADPNLSDTIRERIVSRYTETDIRNMVDAYVSEYGWTNMSDDQILEEILADAYAGIDILDYLTETQGATRYSEIVRGSVGTDNYGVVAGRDLRQEGFSAQDGVIVANDVAERMRTEGFEYPIDFSDTTEWDSHDTLPQWAQSIRDNNRGSGFDFEHIIQLVEHFDEQIWKNMDIQQFLPKGKYAKSKYGPLRTNQEYRYTFDMDTTCPRTFEFLKYRDSIVARAGRPLTFNETINLIELMKAFGRNIPCTYCYVENKRALRAASYNSWYGYHNAVMVGVAEGKSIDDLRPLMYGWNAEKKTLTEAAEKVLNRWITESAGYNPTAADGHTASAAVRNAVVAYLDGALESGVVRFGEEKRNTSRRSLLSMASKNFGITSQGGLAELGKIIDDWQYDTLKGADHAKTVPTDDVDITNADRILEMDHEALNYASSVSSAKMVLDYIPYTDQLKNISADDKQYIIGMGGIRKHSSNDFRIDYVLDYLQFYADLAAGKWTGHTYTKNLDFARIFGSCGDRINISIAFNEDANGVSMNIQEGADWSEAREIRRTHKDVGIMAMATSNRQLSYALNADWIDMCIPFHNSGLNAAVWKNLRAWMDYTAVQNELLYNSAEMREALIKNGKATTEELRGLSPNQIQGRFDEAFDIVRLRDKNGAAYAPHFFPNDTVDKNGNKIPGHHNDKATYLALCKQYGAHPRFEGVMVKDAKGKDIEITEHPKYIKVIKETSRTDTEQEAIQFNFDQEDPYLTKKFGAQMNSDHVSPMDYAVWSLEESARLGGVLNMGEDDFRIVDTFVNEYLDKNRPIGWMDEHSEDIADMVMGDQQKAAAEWARTTAAAVLEAERLGQKEKVQRRNRFTEDQSSEDTSRERRAEFGDELDNIYAAEMQSRDPSWHRQRPERWSTTRSAGNTSEVVPLSTIIREISQKFGVNITEGFVNGRGVLGWYNRRSNGIRSRMEQNLPTIAHELGHALSDRYDALSKLSKEARQELVQAMPVSFTSNYSKAEIPGEGIAEFMRRFLQNPTEERNRCPKAVTEFLNILSETDRELVMHLADEVNALMASDNNSIQDSMRLMEDKAKDYRTAGEKAREKFDAFTTAWVDSFAPINKFQQRYGGSSYILAANSRYAAARAARIIEGWDLRDMHGRSIGTGLRGALAGVDTTNRQEYNDFGEYLIVKHAQERLAEGQRIVANDAKNNIAWMRNRQAELEAKYPQFAEASERLYTFERQFLRAYGVSTGVVDGDQVRQWEDRWKSYVPFYRAQDDGKNYGARRGFANQTSPIKRAIGSGRDIIHPVDNIVSFIIKMTNVGIRNDVMLELVNTADSAGADAMFLERVPDQMVTTAVSTQQIIDEVTENAINYGRDRGMSRDDIEDLTSHMIEDLSDNLFRRRLASPKEDIVTVMRGGRPEYWKVNDKQLLGAITSLSTPKMKGFVEAYAKTTRFMTGMITGSNPVWSIFSNSVRDLMTLAVYSPERNPIKVIRGIASSYLNSFRESYGNQGNLSEYYAEYLAMGGGNASVYTADMDVAKRARKNWGKSKWQRYKTPVVGWGKALLDGVSFLSNTIERGPRYATYLNARQNGMTPEVAFRMAMDVTVDFARAGTWSRQMNAFVQFFNAGVQGIDKAARFFTASDMAGNPAARKKSVIIRNSTMVSVSAVLAGIIHALNHGNADRERDYQQNLATYTKNNYWCIPIGDGKFFTIPKARELSTLESFFERMYELSSGNDHAFTDFYGYVIDNFFPGVVSDILSLPENVANQGSGEGIKTTLRTAIGSAGIAGQIAYYSGNYDYLGRPIVGESLEGLEPKFQYDDSTSKMAYWIGQAFNLSPKRIDYLGKNVLGYVWKLPSAILPLGADRVDWTFGVANTYVRDSEYSTDLVNWLYDEAEKSAIYARSYKDDIAGQLQNKRDGDMKTFYSRFNGLNRTNENESAKRANRQVMLNRIAAYRADADNGYVSEVNEILNEIVAETKDTSILPGVMQPYITYQTTSGKEKIDHRVDLTDSQYLRFQQIYENEFAFLIRQIPASAKSEAEKAQYLKNAKTVAKGRAESAILQNAGIGKSDLDKKYYNVVSDELAEFLYLIDKADDDDGVVYQDEVRAILENLTREGMSEDTADKLWKSRGYKSDR